MEDPFPQLAEISTCSIESSSSIADPSDNVKAQLATEKLGSVYSSVTL